MDGSSSGSQPAGRSPTRRAWAWGSALVILLALLLLPARPAAAASISGARLQEVAPPVAVRQLQQALAERVPKVEILEPADDSLLPDGPWALKLRVEDWPLVDAGPLGLGPHLVVQLDGEPPMPLTALETTLPALAPGSHRLTVYAARPWGEAVKDPGAAQQIRLHRLAANPISLPARGTPQLITVSPSAASPEEPLLLDWLLIDAPLQNLRSGDAGWRLRVTVNGDSFLVDRQTPLWLRGWREGMNPLQLELLDGRGEPLNPPFNSLVSGVNLDRRAKAPAWLGGSLQPLALARLLGEAPIEAEPVAPQAQPASPEAAPSAAEPAPDLPVMVEPTASEPDGTPGAEVGPSPSEEAQDLEAQDEGPQDGEPQGEGAREEETQEQETQEEAAQDEEARDAQASTGDLDDNQQAAQASGARAAVPAARELVNPDGTLIQPKRPSLLSGLRSRFGQ